MSMIQQIPVRRQTHQHRNIPGAFRDSDFPSSGPLERISTPVFRWVLLGLDLTYLLLDHIIVRPCYDAQRDIGHTAENKSIETTDPIQVSV